MIDLHLLSICFLIAIGVAAVIYMLVAGKEWKQDLDIFGRAVLISLVAMALIVIATNFIVKGDNKMAEKKEFKYEIVERIGTLSDNKGYTKDLNIIKWGDNEPKYDIRVWNPENEEGVRTCGKGLTFSKEEIKNLRDIIEDLDLEGED